MRLAASHLLTLLTQGVSIMMIKTVGVVGSGTMGSGIAQACAMSDIQVMMVDINQEALDKAQKTIAHSLERLLSKEKITQADLTRALGLIQTSTQYTSFDDCDLVIEAATENLGLKIKILDLLKPHLKPTAILASNTSSISITQLAQVTQRPDQFIGMHFFNPVPMMALVEVIRGLQTSDSTHEAVIELSKALGKSPITVKNSPGFVVNRILVPMINEALFVLGEGVATAEDIDAGMKLGCNHPIGPLALADMVGLDVCLAVMEVYFNQFSDSKYRAAPLLREMVAAGHLGRKTGRGIYTY